MSSPKEAASDCRVPQPVSQSSAPSTAADLWDSFKTTHRTAGCTCNGKTVNGILFCQWHGMSDDSRKAYLRHKRLQDNFKTEMCRQLRETGRCFFGERCRFAHHASELRPKQRHPKYKTQLCHNYAANGSCPYGANCQFQHRSPERTAGGRTPRTRRNESSQFERSFGSGIWSEDVGDNFVSHFAQSLAASTPTRPGILKPSAFSRSDGRCLNFDATPERSLGATLDGGQEPSGSMGSVDVAAVGAIWQQSVQDSPPSNAWPGGHFATSLGARYFRGQF